LKKEVTLTLLLTIWVTMIIVLLMPYTFDDAYIHFRIAENLSRYFLPYFNISDHVMSTSSFIWSCVLAVLSRLPFSLPNMVAILNSILVIVGSFIWSRLLGVISRKKVSLIATFTFQIAYIGMLLLSAAGLMETPLAMLLLGLSILLLATNRPTGWIVMGIAVFARYEIFVFAGLFLIIWFFNSNIEKKFTGIALFAITLAVLSGIIFYFYLTIIPHTVIAKQVVYQLSVSNIFNNVLFSLFPAPTAPFLGIRFGTGVQKTVLKMLTGVWKPALFLLIVVTFLIVIRARKSALLKAEQWGAGIFAGGLIIALAYIVKHVFLHGWYVPLFSVPILFAVYLAALQGQILVRLMALILSLLPISNLFLYTYAAFVSPSVLPTVCGEIRVQRYLQVGGYLYNLFPNAKLLSSEIGGLGYSFHGEIIDAAGLITPSALKYHPMKVPDQRSSGGIGAIPAKFVGEISPELIVSYPIFVQEFDHSHYVNGYTKISVPAFSKDLQEKTKCEELWGDRDLYIYIRNDLVTDHVVSFLKQKLDK
jgi:hypothetical protein